MKSAIAVAATFALTHAQSSGGWQAQPPTKLQLTQEHYRCACPIPKPIIPSCQQALPVVSSGCGCQPAVCNPKPKEEEMTKVLALQCHDITTWKTEVIQFKRKMTRQNRVKKQRPVQKTKTTYEDKKTIRYRMQMVEEDSIKWETRQVNKRAYKTVFKNVRVAATPENRSDCCRRTATMQISPCACPVTRYITKKMAVQVPVTIKVPKRVQVPSKRKVKKRVPYEVTVQKPIVTPYRGTEYYWDSNPEEYFVTDKRTKRVPIVTRECTDATGRPIKRINEVAMHHSGPDAETQSRLNNNEKVLYKNSQKPVPDSAPITHNISLPVQEQCGGSSQAKCPGKDSSRTYSPAADRRIGNIMSLIQGGGAANPRLNAWAATQSRENIMPTQWGGQFLKEMGSEVADDVTSTSDDE